MSRSFTITTIITILILALFSCNDNKQSMKDQNVNASFIQTLSNRDTMDVLNLSRQCMQVLKTDIDSALNYIYYIQGDTLLLPLSTNRKEFLKATLNKYPIKSCNLVRLKFNSQYNNYLKYKIEFNINNTPNTINLVFNPIKLGEAWYLTLKEK